jgi:hypothetical protein
MKRGEKFIIKVQRSIFTTCAKPRMLFYDKSRQVNVEFDLDPTIAAMMGDSLKMYAFAQLETDGTLNILEKAPSQDW